MHVVNQYSQGGSAASVSRNSSRCCQRAEYGLTQREFNKLRFLGPGPGPDPNSYHYEANSYKILCFVTPFIEQNLLYGYMLSCGLSGHTTSIIMFLLNELERPA